MNELHLPWLELAIVAPLLGAGWVGGLRNTDRARRRCLHVTGLALALTLAAWVDFLCLRAFEAHDRWDLMHWLFGVDVLAVHELSASLLPLAGLLHFLTQLSTMRTKAQRYSFAWSLVSLSILLATMSCKLPWGVIALLIAGTAPTYFELRRRSTPLRVYVLHMGAFAALLLVGQSWISWEGEVAQHSVIPVVMLTLAMLLRSGVAPMHCWMTDLFEHATFGTALLFVTPMVGAYGAMRVVLPIAPAWVLSSIAWLSLATAVYAAGMALVQREARRFFCYLFLSHSSLVLVGLESATPLGLTGAMCVWLSVSLAMAGFGLTLRMVEARTGRLALDNFHGLYGQIPTLASFFLVTGLASIGFPGTIGFVGAELLVESAVQVSPWVGLAVVLTAALNGLAVTQAYFRVFTGATHGGSLDLTARYPERVSVLVLSALIIGGGLFPQPGVSSRYHAAVEVLRDSGLLAAAADPEQADSKARHFAPRTPRLPGNH